MVRQTRKTSNIASKNKSSEAAESSVAQQAKKYGGTRSASKGTEIITEVQGTSASEIPQKRKITQPTQTVGASLNKSPPQTPIKRSKTVKLLKVKKQAKKMKNVKHKSNSRAQFEEDNNFVSMEIQG